MEKVRIASITYDYYPFDVRVRRLAEAAADAGYAMDVICLRDAGEAARETYDGVEIVRLPMSRGFGQSLLANIVSWLWFTVRAGMVVARLHLRKRYDVIHVHNMPDMLVFSALVPKLLGARVILDIQDVSPELMAAKASGKRRALLMRLAAIQERVSTRFADVVVTVGWPFERKLLERGLKPGKLRIILNSADPKIFPEARRFAADEALAPVSGGGDAAPFIVMYWGTVAERNGVATAIRALKLALPQAPNLYLDIMGRGEYVPTLRRLAEQLGIADRVRFSDPVPAERIVDFVVHGDAGIIPYQADGFADLVLPTKAYELAWLRRPIIASDTTAIRSMFRPESMRLCQPDDAEGFAQALVALYHDPAERRRMVISAAEDYEPYRWEREAARYTALLAALAQKRPLAIQRPGDATTVSASRER